MEGDARRARRTGELGPRRSGVEDQPDFPRPVVELATGRVWLKSQVQSYLTLRRAS